MTGGHKRRVSIQELLFDGYNQVQIATKLNVSERTVRRDVRKIRESDKRWLDEIFPNKMVSLVHETSEGVKKDIVFLREMLNKDNVKEDVSLTLKILKAISELRHDYFELITHTPLVWSLKQFAKRNNLKSQNSKSAKGIYGEIRGYEYEEASSQNQSYSEPLNENKFKN